MEWGNDVTEVAWYRARIERESGGVVVVRYIEKGETEHILKTMAKRRIRFGGDTSNEEEDEVEIDENVAMAPGAAVGTLHCTLHCRSKTFPRPCMLVFDADLRSIL